MAANQSTRGDNRLTETALRRTKLPTSGKLILQDGGGLFFEVSEAGGRRIARASYRFRLAGKRPEMRLGTWPDKTLAKLRELRNEARALVKDGKDPREAARQEKARAAEERAAEAARLTVRQAFDKWDRLHLQCALKDEGKEVRRYFEKDVFPTLDPLPLEDLSRAKVAALVDSVLERGAPRAAQSLLGYLRQFCRWSVTRGYLDADPTAAFRKASIKTNGPRDRALSEKEIQMLAELLPAAGLPAWAPPAIWLLLATAARVGELLTARWEDFDLEAKEWTIPAGKAKNGRAHVVHLSAFALARLAELEELKSSAWLVAGRTPAEPGKEPEHTNIDGLSKMLRDRQRPAGFKPLKGRKASNTDALILPGGRWTPHDLRRTAATLLQRLGILPAIIERVLNHTEPNGLVAVYQRYDYRAERREALNRLGTHLETLTQGKQASVVGLNTARA